MDLFYKALRRRKPTTSAETHQKYLGYLSDGGLAHVDLKTLSDPQFAKSLPRSERHLQTAAAQFAQLWPTHIRDQCLLCLS